jgi:hypothetical protein
VFKDLVATPGRCGAYVFPSPFSFSSMLQSGIETDTDFFPFSAEKNQNLAWPQGPSLGLTLRLWKFHSIPELVHGISVTSLLDDGYQGPEFPESSRGWRSGSTFCHPFIHNTCPQLDGSL